MNYHIRPILAEDVPELCRLLNTIIETGGTTAYVYPLSESEFSEDFLPGTYCHSCLVCDSKEHGLLGFQSLSNTERLPDGWADIATFARTTDKVKGVGTWLFQATLTAARASKFTVLNATIRADNTAGLGYYDKMGFIDYKRDKSIPLATGQEVDRLSKRYTLL